MARPDDPDYLTAAELDRVREQGERVEVVGKRPERRKTARVSVVGNRLAKPKPVVSDNRAVLRAV